MRKLNGPSFVGIGASYAGLSQVTTWLSEHSEIVDKIPASNFFNTSNFEKRGFTWYEEKINSSVRKNGQKTGDVTPGYLTTPGVAERISAHYPDTKLFVIVRHPLKRALAEYEAHRAIDTRAAKMTASEYMATNNLLQQYGCYADYLSDYFGYYSPVDLKIVIYEEMALSPLQEIQKLYGFLGVDERVVPKSLKQFAPPPDPPKNPGLIKRAYIQGKSIYKKMTERPIGPVFPTDPNVDLLLTPEEKKLFTEAFLAPTERLSHLMDRDMVSFWDLAEG